MMENNAISVDISFTIHGRGAISVMPKGLDQSPNFVELVLINNLDEFVLPVEIPIDILFTENGRIGIDSNNIGVETMGAPGAGAPCSLIYTGYCIKYASWTINLAFRSIEPLFIEPSSYVSE